MIVTGSGEKLSSRFIMSHTCSIGEKTVDLAGQGSYTPRRARFVAAAVCERALPAEKAHHLPVEEMAVERG